MDQRYANALGYGNGYDNSRDSGLGFLFSGGLPQPLTSGNDSSYRPDKHNAPVYSSAGVPTSMSTPWTGMNGVTAPGQQTQYTANPGSMDSMLGATLSAGHAGNIDRGAAAFLGAGYNPWAKEITNSGDYVSNPNQPLSALYDTARGLGMDTSKYSTELGGVDMRGNRLTGSSGQPDAVDLYNDLNNYARDYVSVGGLSNGWAGGPANNSSRTIYKDVGGKLLPTTRPMFHMDNVDNGLISRDAIQGMSLMLPAFGGWAGMLGNGAAGTLTANGGLGLTSGLSGTIGTGATNALVNAGMNGLINGNMQGALGGLLQTGAGAGLSSITGGSGLSNLFNTAGASSALNINPMSYYTSALRSSGLGGSPLGQGIQGLQGIRSLANLFGRA